ncbi:MJ1255/VC2487 family glycosyltransferase [Pleionea sediminis]|uniref:MJ1255/VC2487 family glycosyltransferase n=1 Tax=Pleionea sediminis TaxID=2569479 RepID=UPI001184C9B0|nr:MJ1255/VC2487 family glycosyltransferase [Pleionea sediminis]
MKILYGVQGTGNGHITRARVMAEEFKKKDISVDWVFSGRPDFDYFDMECFGNYRSFRGLTFVIENGSINYTKTAMQLQFRKFFNDVKSLDLTDYDYVINDFEPISAWAARRQKRLSIGISHQSSFLYNIPKEGNNLFTDLVMKWFAPVDHPIGVHWHHFNSPILPPIINHQFAESTVENHILVYFPFQSLQRLIALLKPFTDYQFYIYHPVENAFDEGNIHVRALSTESFKKELQKTSGVICGAGFELPSETLQLGKKLLVQPVGGQMEQRSNAKALQELGLASVSKQFNHEELSAWLLNHQTKKFNLPNTAKAIVEWLVYGDLNNYNALVDSLWQQTQIATLEQKRASTTLVN